MKYTHEYVYIVALFSTEQRYDTCICKTFDGAEHMLRTRGMMRLEHNLEALKDMWMYRGANDMSHTATVRRIRLLD